MPHVWISGWCVQTLITERKETVKKSVIEGGANPCGRLDFVDVWKSRNDPFHSPLLALELCDNPNHGRRVEDLVCN